MERAEDQVRDGLYSTSILRRRWLSSRTIEIALERPGSFDFQPGQSVRLIHGHIDNAYTMICAPDAPQLEFCIVNTGGRFTSFLSSADIGAPLEMAGPKGYFTYRPSTRRAVFVATGTGVAPFIAYSRSGVRGFTLLHGVSSQEELYYKDSLRSSASLYVACLSTSQRGVAGVEGGYAGRVTDYVRDRLERGPCDFYLCGRSDMIRDVIHLVDEGFPGSYVYTEPFF